MEPRAVCFDLDGTLTRGTTVSEHLAAWLGHADELPELERAYAAHEISNAVVAERTGRHFAGIPVSDVRAQLEQLPLIDGIAETVAALDVPVLLASVTWSLAVEVIAERFEMVALGGTRMAVAGGRLLGTVARHCNEHDKAAAVRAWCDRHDVPLAALAAVGDSRSDLPLFALAGRAIALNATPAARAAADVAIDADDLRAVLAVLGYSATT
jgi:phosphoserine phosphatase